MEDSKVQKYGPATGKHGSCTFYKAFKYTREEKSEIISLGQFFFLKIIDGIPVCIGELQLVWEDKTASQDLASVRLYFLPECTPDGRQSFHGEDEVLAYSEKIILKLDDLAGLVVHNVSWSDGRRAHADEKLQAYPEQAQLVETFKLNSFGLDTKDVVSNENEEEGTPNTTDESPSIIIMSFARYCRYRAVLLRLKNCEDKWLRHAIVCAIGGFSSKKENNRIYFCRDTFEHSDLDDLEIRCDHLAPNLKGRPRKRKGSKFGTENDSSEESNCSSSFSSQNENATNKIRTGARDTPLRNGFRIDKAKVSKDEQAFLIDLHKFMKSQFTPIGRIPSLGFKQIDLYQFYSLAEEIGGYEQICNKRMWKHLYDKLGGNPGFTSAATCTRRHYEKLLLPYERYRKGMDNRGLVQKKKKFKQEEPSAIRLEPPATPVKIETNQAVVMKEEKKNGDPLTPVTSPLNGQMVHPVSVDTDKDRALIIKMEIEEMKARKVRKPSGSQKTVRELLHKNGRDHGDIHTDKSVDRRHDNHYERHSIKVGDRPSDSLQQDPSVSNMKQKHGLPGLPDARSHAPPILSPLTQQHPLFYPMIPLGGQMRGMPPVMPFMLPQFGLQSMPSAVSSAATMGSSSFISSAPTYDSHLGSSSSAILSNGSKPTSNTATLSAPPSNHVKSPKGPNSSKLGQPVTAHQQILPAHSHNEKRQYPPPHAHGGPIGEAKYSGDARQYSPARAHSGPPGDGKYSVDAKKPKLSSSPLDLEKPAISGYDMPVLDLSMKTLRAQEARQKRGESLLFNTSFGKESKPSVKQESLDAPQDLSLKVPKSSPADLSKRSSTLSVHRNVPLNIPQHRSLLDINSLAMSSVKSEPSKRSSENKTEKSETTSLSSAYKIPSLGLGEFPTIGGLPIDMGAFVHPAFPQQLLMQGVFPTPQQLQQLIQGQVSAGLPMAPPDLIPGAPLMYPPGFSSIPSSLFSSTSPVYSRTSSNSTNGSSSKR